MNHLQIIRESGWICLNTRALRLLIFLNAVISILGVLVPTRQSILNNHSLLCIAFPVQVGLMILHAVTFAGMAFVAHRAILGKEVSFSEGWSRGKSSCIRVISTLILVIIPLGLMTAFLTYSTRWPLTALFLLIESIIVVLSWFIVVAIVVDDLRLIDALRIGYMLASRNLIYGQILVIIFAIINLLPLAILLITLIVPSYRTLLPDTLTLNYATYLALLGVPLISWANRIFGWFIFPLTTVAWVIVYDKFTTGTVFPAILAKREVA